MSSRKELIEKFAKKANLPKGNAGLYLQVILEVIEMILSRTGEMKLPGFGTLNSCHELIGT